MQVRARQNRIVDVATAAAIKVYTSHPMRLIYQFHLGKHSMLVSLPRKDRIENLLTLSAYVSRLAMYDSHTSTEM